MTTKAVSNLLSTGEILQNMLPRFFVIRPSQALQEIPGRIHDGQGSVSPGVLKSRQPFLHMIYFYSTSTPQHAVCTSKHPLPRGLGRKAPW